MFLISLLQELKKETKSLEVLNEKLDFIQNAWQTQGVFRDVQTQVMCSVWVHVSLVSHLSSPVEQHVGLAKSHNVVKEECLKQANFITQTKQVVS